VALLKILKTEVILSMISPRHRPWLPHPYRVCRTGHSSLGRTRNGGLLMFNRLSLSRRIMARGIGIVICFTAP
jgi:hypothetical protein